jgi:hypothetical protein
MGLVLSLLLLLFFVIPALMWWVGAIGPMAGSIAGSIPVVVSMVVWGGASVGVAAMFFGGLFHGAQWVWRRFRHRVARIMWSAYVCWMVAWWWVLHRGGYFDGGWRAWWSYFLLMGIFGLGWACFWAEMEAYAEMEAGKR